MKQQNDATNKEQVVVCLQWVDNALEAHEDFIGLYEVESTEASAVLAVIRDVEYPSPPRKRKAPKRYDSGSCGSDPPASVQDYYRPIFFWSDRPHLL